MRRPTEFVIRAITSAGIGVITLTLVTFTSWSFLVWLGLVGLLGGFEFLRLIGRIPARGSISPVSALLSLSACLALCLFAWTQDVPWLMPLLGTVMILAISMTLLHSIHPEVIVARGRLWIDAFLYPLLPLMSGLAFIQPTYRYSFVLLPVILIWINDVMAYVIGRQWGRRPIAPEISPGKTIEGTLGAALLTVVASLLMLPFFPDVPRGYSLALGFLVPLLALTGDLWESAMKRQAGVKDSGRLLPGHGGVLDRYDSFVFVLPVAALLYCIFVT